MDIRRNSVFPMARKHHLASKRVQPVQLKHTHAMVLAAAPTDSEKARIGRENRPNCSNAHK